ncbi:TIGR03089 family protein [Allonocardiopsis opalescens]|uniref:Uncharacterized protein (TIGR03089 family) n=1 Tax=Allonocardiopsis opalescens TaxID=1144618 RepID=A0A2T0QC95_9ACTN|nr:TIGR03089 family protein [Allonocardiopsis opalescens]PRY01473.1 uncharacterized protein (TIGR03089 family) [Allonocardiopsis opalescens]
MTGSTPADLLRAALRADPGRPFLTCHDSAGRIELSYATFDNWVAKTANFLVDELAADPGDRVGLAVPVHWQSAAWLLACWSAGLTAVPLPPEGEPEPAAPVDVLVAGPANLDRAVGSAAGRAARDLVGLSLHPLGLPLADPPPGVVDYAAEVRGHGDHFASAAPADPAAPALEAAGEVLSAGRLAAGAAETAARWNLEPGDRLALVDSPHAPLLAPGGAPPLDWLLPPLAAGASSVLFLDADTPGTAGAGRPAGVTRATAQAALGSRFGSERITAILERALGGSAPPAPVRQLR